MKGEHYYLTHDESVNLAKALESVIEKVTEKVAVMINKDPNECTQQQREAVKETIACSTVILLSEIVFKMVDLPFSEYQNMLDHIAQFFKENPDKWKLNALSKKNEQIH